MSKTETTCGQPTDPLHLALHYAKRWPVFPCNPLTKTPIEGGGSGHLSATTDANTIRRWWQEYPNAMVGCPTGPKSGFWALDADIDREKGKDGVAVVAAMGVLPDTVEQFTPRGGRHTFFRWDDTRPVRNSVSKIGPGVDTRGDGGYVILAGSKRSDGAIYQWSISPENGEICEAPEWLYAEYRKARPKPEIPSELAATFPFDVERITEKAGGVLKEQCLIVASAPSGKRNDALNSAAFQVGVYVGKSEISAAKVEQALMWAAGSNGMIDDDGEESARKTIASGLTSGIKAGYETTPAHWHEPVMDDPAPAVVHWSQPASKLAGKDVPAQRWLVPEMIPARTVTLLYGDGGTGKSLVSLQLAFSAATSGRWLDRDVTQGAALFVTAEDEDEEVHRRVSAISQGSGYTLEDLGNLHWRSLAGQQAVLASPKPTTGLMEESDVMKALRVELNRLRPVVLVLDTLADLFGGDEIKRIQARQFIQMLQGLIVQADWDLSIVLLAHPSVAGMNSGTGTSGSTAWSNSVRSRLYLERCFGKGRGAKDDKEKVEIDPDVRVLSTKKANRTKQGGEVKVRWAAGRFIAQATTIETTDAEADASDEIVFLEIFDKLTRANQNLNSSVNAPNYAPKLFLSDPAGSQVGRKGLEGAMARLLLQGTLAIEDIGSPKRPRFRLIKRSSDLFG